MTTSPTQLGWERIFEQMPLRAQLSSQGIAYITANQINQHSGREPRLMTKFDTRASRPRILRDAGNTILAVENGRYALVQADGYKDVEPAGEVTAYPTARNQSIETLPWEAGFSSESQVLDAVHIVSLLCRVTGEEQLFLTVRGRLRSPNYSFKIGSGLGTHQLDVAGVQIEVDAGYEGDRVYLIEAKLGHRDDFIVRQLYYPYRMWLERGISKEVIPVLLTYSNKIFSFRQYRFADSNTYDSIELEHASDFILGQPEEPVELQTALSGASPRTLPPGIPFPQADDLQKVIDLADVVAQGITDKEEIAELFEYDPRQSDYYGNAAAFLGLVDRRSRGFIPNASLSAFVHKTHAERIAEVTSRLSSLPVFREALDALASGQLLSREETADIIRREAGLRGTTPFRRALTVQSWVRWIQQATI